MKKLLLFSAAMLAVCQLKAQIIVTGVMYDPKSADAPAVGLSYTPTGGTVIKDSQGNDRIFKGGYEYLQFMATQDIDFAQTNYSVVICRNAGASSAPAGGWAEGGDRTIKFDLTSGTVAKGTYFYVGGPEKTLAGYVGVEDNGALVYTPTLDISSRNWIKTIAYSGTPGTTVGDGFGNSTTGLMGNSGNPLGIAVFSSTNVLASSVPIDAVFVTSANPINSTSKTATYTSGTPDKGYRISTNDRYAQQVTDENSVVTLQPLFGMGTNTYGFLYQGSSPFSLATDMGNFLKLGGKYDATTKTWIEPRTASYVTLVPTADAAGAAFGTLAMIESGGATVLPVSLVSFTAKNQNNGVALNWSTASEKNNKQFTVLRSIDGKKFSAIGSVFGKGTTNSTSSYNFVDGNPVAGVNYYQLIQIDNDGKTQESAVISATTDLEKASVSVYANNQLVNLNVFAVKADKGTITLFDINGKRLATKDVDFAKGYNNVPLAAPLNAGVYVASIQIGSEVVQAKFVQQ